MVTSKHAVEYDQVRWADRRCVVSGLSAVVAFVVLVATTSNLSLGQEINAVVYRIFLPVLATVVVVSYLLLFTVGMGSNTRLWADVSKAVFLISLSAVLLSLCAVGGVAASILF